MSTDYEFVWLPRDEKFLKENDTQCNRKIHADDRLEFTRVPFDQGSQKRSQIQHQLFYRGYIRAIVPMTLN
jgi:hypothetical protein